MPTPSDAVLAEDAYGRTTARYYDAVYEALRGESGDVEFYRDLARGAGGPVLELGCGTGRVLLPIAREGIPCTGLDRSSAMLDALRSKPYPPTLRLVSEPMQDFDLGGDRFGLIYSAFRCFQHLLDPADQLACLACVRRHLAPGGRFAFDVFNPDPARLAEPGEVESEDASVSFEGDELARSTAAVSDRDAQELRLRMIYTRSRGGEIVERESVAFSMRYFFEPELRALLQRAGFEIQSIHGDFRGRPFESGAPEIVIVARVGEGGE